MDEKDRKLLQVSQEVRKRRRQEEAHRLIRTLGSIQDDLSEAEYWTTYCVLEDVRDDIIYCQHRLGRARKRLVESDLVQDEYACMNVGIDGDA